MNYYKRGDILTPLKEKILENYVDGQARTLDSEKLKELIMLGATKDDVCMILEVHEDMITDWCYTTYELSWEDTKIKLMEAFKPLSIYYTLQGAKRGNSVAMRTLANSFGEVMDIYDREMLSIKQKESEKKGQASEIVTNLFESFLGNVNAENEFRNKERKE